MKDKERIGKYINWITLIVLGAFCYFYSIFWSNFSELNIRFSFLNFPVFVGEILLGFCLIMFFLKCIFSPIKFNRWHYLILFYALFILGKAFHGYSQWGALAFRNAALFYYAAFAVIGYYFYSSRFFSNKFIKYALLSLLISSFFVIPVGPFIANHTLFRGLVHKAYYFNYLILILIFLMGLKVKRPLKYVIIALFMVLSYRSVWITVLAGRNGLVAGTLCYAFIFFIYLIYFLDLHSKYKKIGILASLVLISLIFWNVAGNKLAAGSIINIKSILKAYRQQLSVIEERENSFSFANPVVKLYERNKPDLPKLESSSKQESESLKPVPPAKPVATDKERAEDIIAKLEEYKLRELVRKGSDRYFLSSDTVEGQFEFIPNGASSEKASVVSVEEIEITGPPQKKPVLVPEFVKKRFNKYYQSKEELPQEIKAENKISVKEAVPEDPFQEMDREELARYINSNYKIFETQRDKSLRSPFLSGHGYQSNILYRLFMWHDMFSELLTGKKVLGTDFGRPFRSKGLEISRFDESWKTRVGWVEPHNSYVHMIYRAGIAGLLVVFVSLILWVRMVVAFIRTRNFRGILLASILLYWFTIANFMVIMELPHFAIPFWCLFGMVLRYSRIKKEAAINE